MSIWSHVNGVICIDGAVTEEQLINIYGIFSHDLVGSEGGLNISFTYTYKKSYSSSAESDYNVEPFKRLSNMVFHGDLRDFDEYKLDNAVESLKRFLMELNKRVLVFNSSFVLECEVSEVYYHLAYVKDRVRVKKMKIKR